MMKRFLQNTVGGFLGVALIAATSMGISGGPNYGTSVSVTGSYAGVLSPHPCSAPTPAPDASPTVTPAGRCGANSIGIFSLTVPASGSATGPLIIFLEGQAYNGTMTGTADPATGKVSGLLSASFSYQTQVVSSIEDTFDKETGRKTGTKTSYTNQTYAASAAGQLNASVQQKRERLVASSQRLKGYADVQFNLTVNNPFDEIWYDVVGYKQSSSTGLFSTGL